MLGLAKTTGKSIEEAALAYHRSGCNNGSFARGRGNGRFRNSLGATHRDLLVFYPFNHRLRAGIALRLGDFCAEPAGRVDRRSLVRRAHLGALAEGAVRCFV